MTKDAGKFPRPTSALKRQSKLAPQGLSALLPPGAMLVTTKGPIWLPIAPPKPPKRIKKASRQERAAAIMRQLGLLDANNKPITDLEPTEIWRRVNKSLEKEPRSPGAKPGTMSLTTICRVLGRR